jgi:tripartite-type tricarboxylate transporter receptor subunit TctC
MKKALFAFLAFTTAASLAFGQATDSHSQPVKVIVGTSAGTTADSLARYVGQELSGMLGQPVVVENRPGGDGVVSIMALKGAPADGNTLLVTGNTPMAVNPLVMKNLSYDPFKDLRPVSGIAQSMNVLVVAPGSPVNTLADLIAHAKKSKQPLNVGTAFLAYFLDVSTFANVAGVKFNNIPYKGTTQVITDVIGQQLDFGFIDRAVAAPLVKSGKLKALAVTGKTRHPDFADIPTVGESGYPQYSAYAWSALFVRSETPDAASARLADAMQKVLAKEKTQVFIKGLGVQPMAYQPDAMKAFVLQEYDKYRAAVQSLGIRPE